MLVLLLALVQVLVLVLVLVLVVSDVLIVVVRSFAPLRGGGAACTNTAEFFDLKSPRGHETLVFLAEPPVPEEIGMPHESLGLISWLGFRRIRGAKGSARV